MSRLDDLFFIGFQEHLREDFELLKSRLWLPSDRMLPDGRRPDPREPVASGPDVWGCYRRREMVGNRSV